MTRSRVAYILLWFPEPSQTFVLEEVNTLVRLGLDVRVYTLYGPRPAGRLAGMAPAAAPIVNLGLASLGTLWSDLRHRTWHPGQARFWRRVMLRRWRSLETAGEALWAALAGVHLARRFTADGITHVHAPWATGPATAAWVASELSGIPFSFSARAYDLYPPDGALAEKFQAAAFVRTNTRGNQRHLAELFPGGGAKIVNIYNGVSLPQPGTRREPSSPPFNLLAAGRMVPKKGFADLLAACRLLQRQEVDFRLTLAGDGPQLSQLQRLVQEYGLTERVRFPGFVPHRNMAQLLAAAHLFIMPSVIAPSGDRDGIPNVVLEALFYEVPVVATAVSGIPEVVRAGATGWLAPPHDPASLARALLEALQDREKARRLARAGRELVAREFDSRRNYAELKGWFEGTMK
jgi:colanic acid/amylovoran biosynthesis glycosyltransferase